MFHVEQFNYNVNIRPLCFRSPALFVGDGVPDVPPHIHTYIQRIVGEGALALPLIHINRRNGSPGGGLPYTFAHRYYLFNGIIQHL